MDLARLIAAHGAARTDPARAEALCREVLAGDPDNAFALHLLGVLALRSARIADAVRTLRRAAEMRPDHTETLIALAEAEGLLGDDGAAAATLQRIISLQPAHAEARAALALARLRQQDVSAALADAEAAHRLRPDSVECLVALGAALSAAHRPQHAVEALRRAVLLGPAHARAHLNLGNTLLDLDAEAEAERHVRQATMLDPACAEAWASLGFLLAGTDRLEEAVAACDAAIGLRPDFPQAYWNRSFARLRGGDFARGWADYEWRLRHPSFATFDPPGRRWEGEDLAGRHLLVYATQGLGDTIQFARFLPGLAQRAGHVTLACAPPLLSLLRQLPVAAVSRDQALPDYDVWIDQMSLPRVLGTRPDTIPLPGGYLRAEPTPRGHGLRVGLVCAGNPAHSNDFRRSMRPADLAPLRELAGVAFESLQVGPASRDLCDLFGIPDAAPGDFLATARRVAGLDLVVAVDTSTAHLAGALGVPAWIMLPRASDWRWLAGTAQSPWYDSARLFRQRRAGDWAPVVAAIGAGLADIVERVKLAA